MMIKKGYYRHFKGGKYKVLGQAKHSETLEDMVIYKALYQSKDFAKGTLWVRPKKMFQESVLIKGKKNPRFKYLGKIFNSLALGGSAFGG